VVSRRISLRARQRKQLAVAEEALRELTEDALSALFWR
jgi:hypothetical protein